MDGLQTISDLMTRCHFREKLFPQDSCTELRDASVDLYSIIFEYQARCVYHLSLRSTKRALKDTLETNDWTGMLDKIDKADKKCANLLALLDKLQEHKLQEHKLQERQAQELDHQTKMFEDFQRKFSESREYDLEAKLMASLASDYANDKALIARRVEGTCRWFLRDERFRRWRDSASSSLLWISAGPGCGKSVLAKTLIDECRLSSASALHTTTCYFFFKEGEERRTKAANALSAMLHQLFDQNPQLMSNALPSSKSYGDKLSNTFSELWKVLNKTAEDVNAGHIICVLDALDECEGKSIQMVIDKIIGYYGDRSQHSSSAVLKFLVTSRPYSQVRSAFGHLQGVNEYVHFDGDERSTDISNEINLVIDYKVPRLTENFPTKDRERILSRLKGMKHRTYLWLHLTLNIIDRERGKYSKPSEIETLLSNLPVDVSGAYERILLQSKNPEYARTLLQIIIAARRPLKLSEANVALAVATQNMKPRDLDDLDLWPEESFRSTVQDMCGLFVSVYDDKLSLIHQTARGFLLQAVTDDSSGIASEDQKWSRCFTMQCAHELLCSICVEYLTLNDFTKQTAGSKQRENHASALSGALVFFDYAAKKWYVHYGQLPQQKRGRLQTGAITLCKPDSISASWLTTNSLKYPSPHSLRKGAVSDWSPIGIASVLGLADIVQCLLAGAMKVDHRAGHFGTATRAAIVMDHTEVLRVLCPFNTSARFQRDPRSDVIDLQIPRARLSLSFETILQRVAKIRVSDDLYYAVSLHSSLKIIRILLEHGADPNVQDDKGETLLLETLSIYSMDKIYKSDRVRLLLEFGADPDMPSKSKITPLQLASRGPHPAVVRLLLQGAEIIQLLRNAGAEEDIEEASNEEVASDEEETSDEEEASDEEETSEWDEALGEEQTAELFYVSDFE